MPTGHHGLTSDEVARGIPPARAGGLLLSYRAASTWLTSGSSCFLRLTTFLSS